MYTVNVAGELDTNVFSTRCCLPVSAYVQDAVYLYLRTVNQTLAEGNSDFKDGRYIRNKTIGQRFVGRFLDIIVIDSKPML